MSGYSPEFSGYDAWKLRSDREDEREDERPFLSPQARERALAWLAARVERDDRDQDQ